MDLVKQLREQSGVGMMDCKKALEEASGDLEKATELLRKKGMAVAAKRSANVTDNGLIQGSVSQDFKRASLLEIGCETDFAARTGDMQTFATDLAESFMTAGQMWDSVDLFMTTEIKKTGKQAQALLDELVARISEKILVSRIEVASSSDAELVNVYIHPDGTLGVLVQISADRPIMVEHRPALAALAKDVCMQVAVTNPLSISSEHLNPSVVAKEREIAQDMLNGSKKPEQIVEKIVEGKLRKFYEDNCLAEQKFIKDEQLTVAQYMEKVGKAYGLKLKIEKVARYGIKR
jgi:elongation factor Ts